MESDKWLPLYFLVPYKPVNLDTQKAKKKKKEVNILDSINWEHWD